jgi:hypothetical protein
MCVSLLHCSSVSAIGTALPASARSHCSMFVYLAGLRSIGRNSSAVPNSAATPAATAQAQSRALLSSTLAAAVAPAPPSPVPAPTTASAPVIVAECGNHETSPMATATATLAPSTTASAPVPAPVLPQLDLVSPPTLVPGHALAPTVSSTGPADQAQVPAPPAPAPAPPVAVDPRIDPLASLRNAISAKFSSARYHVLSQSVVVCQTCEDQLPKGASATAKQRGVHICNGDGHSQAQFLSVLGQHAISKSHKDNLSKCAASRSAPQGRVTSFFPTHSPATRPPACQQTVPCTGFCDADLVHKFRDGKFLTLDIQLLVQDLSGGHVAAGDEVWYADSRSRSLRHTYVLTLSISTCQYLSWSGCHSLNTGQWQCSLSYSCTLVLERMS